MHFFKILALNLLLIDKPSPIPESNERHFGFEIKTDPQFDLFPDWNAMDAEAQAVEGNSAIGINDSLVTITEDVIDCLKGRLDDEGTEKVFLFLGGPCKSKRRDFSGG